MILLIKMIMSIQWMLLIYLYEEEIDGADNFCRDLADVRPLNKSNIS